MSYYSRLKSLIGNPNRLWSTDAGLSWLLVTLTLYLFFVSPLARHLRIGEALKVLFLLVLLSAVLCTSSSTRMRLLMLLAVVPMGALQWLVDSSFHKLLHAFQQGFNAAFCGLVVVAITGRVFERGPKTGHRVRGAIAVYLMLGLMWAALYQFVDVLFPGSFQFPQSLEGALPLSELRDSAFFYFSFVTLTTVGYGDMVAVEPFARSLTLIEALIGQLFPAVLIARLVALQVGDLERELADRDSEIPPEDHRDTSDGNELKE